MVIIIIIITTTIVIVDVDSVAGHGVCACVEHEAVQRDGWVRKCVHEIGRKADLMPAWHMSDARNTSDLAGGGTSGRAGRPTALSQDDGRGSWPGWSGWSSWSGWGRGSGGHPGPANDSPPAAKVATGARAGNHSQAGRDQPAPGRPPPASQPASPTAGCPRDASHFDGQQSTAPTDAFPPA
jgi:hypothetical protein